jgi:hypothetical protein
MVGTRKKKSTDEVKDEPGAEERFKGILKRALNTPPKRKAEAEQRTRKASRPKG